MRYLFSCFAVGLVAAVAYAGPSIWSKDITKGTGVLAIVQYAPIDASTNDNQLIAANPTKRIRVLSYSFVCALPVDVRFEAGIGGTPQTGQMQFLGNSGISDYCGQEGCFELPVNTPLNMELSSPVSVDGRISFVYVP